MSNPADTGQVPLTFVELESLRRVAELERENMCLRAALQGLLASDEGGEATPDYYRARAIARAALAAAKGEG